MNIDKCIFCNNILTKDNFYYKKCINCEILYQATIYGIVINYNLYKIYVSYLKEKTSISIYNLQFKRFEYEDSFANELDEKEYSLIIKKYFDNIIFI